MIEENYVPAEANYEASLSVVLTIPEAIAATFHDTNEPEKPKVILLVEDEAFVRGVTAEVLQAAGYISLAACNAAEAFVAQTKFRGNIDLLLADMVMPGIGGHELAGAFIKLCPRIQILLMSGYAEQQPGHECSPFYLAKPFTSAMLLAKVRLALDAHTYTASALV